MILNNQIPTENNDITMIRKKKTLVIYQILKLWTMKLLNFSKIQIFFPYLICLMPMSHLFHAYLLEKFNTQSWNTYSPTLSRHKHTGFESSQIFNLHIVASGIFGYMLNGKITCKIF